MTSTAGTAAPARRAQSSEEVFRILSKAAYVTCYSGFDIEQPSIEHPLIPFLPLFGYFRELFQAGRRIQMTIAPPTVEGGFQIRNQVGREIISKNYLILKITPNYFQPNFDTERGLNPAPTVLLPFLPTKSELINEKFDLLDGRGSQLHLNGVSRTYPATGGIFIAGVGDITESHGYVQDAVGHIGVSGYSRLPPNFSLILVFRLADPGGRLLAKSPLPPIPPAERLLDLYPFSVIMPLMAELHPGYPVVIEPAEDGKKQVRLVERVRLCDPQTVVGPNLIASSNALGPVVGERRTTLVFDPADPLPVIPVYTKDSEFRFFAAGDKTIGTLRVEVSEARAMRTTAPDLVNPYFRLGGYGHFAGGTGQFDQLEGVLTVTGAFSLTPPAVSSLYLLRINDPLHRLRPLGT
jgi:hypothetical protein